MNHPNKSKQNFQIEDGTDSDESDQFEAKEQHHPPKPIQTSFFSALDSIRSTRKKPVPKIQQADFLSHYDENFDDVFGDKPIVIPIIDKKKEEQKDKDEVKKKKVNRKKKKETSESEAQETESQQANKQNKISSEKSKEKSEEENKQKNKSKQKNTRTRQKPQVQQQQKQGKQSSEDQLSEQNKFDPNTIDLPQAKAANKKDKKQQKLKTATFNFGNENDEKQTKHKEVKKKRKKDKHEKQEADETIRKTRNRRVIEDDDEQIDKLFQQYAKGANKQKEDNKKNDQKNEGKDEILTTKADNSDHKSRLNLDQLKTNPLIPECKPQKNNDV